MIKDRLTVEESEELINLGIPWYYATILRTEVPSRSCGFRDVHFFTLTNLLDLIPKVIRIENKKYFFILQTLSENLNTGLWISGYADTERNINPNFKSEQPIDAITQVVKWCLEKGYLKFDKE